METRIFEEFRVRHGDTADKVAFLILSVGGALGIYVARSSGLGEKMVTIILVCAMLGYVAGALLVGKLKLRPDQIGDNCYYLGFIYTLASLGYSLYTFASFGRNIDAVSSLISNFGIAICTTMLGIILRVILHQMRSDPADVEQEARLALSASALRVRAELDQVVMHLNSFRDATKQSIAEAFEDISNRTGSALSSSTASVETAVRNAAEKLDSALSKFSENSLHLEENSAKLDRVIAALVEKIDSIELTPDVITRKLETGVAGIDKVVKRLQHRISKEDERVAAIEALIQRSAATASQFEKTSTAASETALALRKTIEQIETADRETQKFGEAAHAAAEALNVFDGIAPKLNSALLALTNWAEHLPQRTASAGYVTSDRPIVVPKIPEERPNSFPTSISRPNFEDGPHPESAKLEHVVGGPELPERQRPGLFGRLWSR